MVRDDEKPERSQLAVTIITLRSRRLWSHDALANAAAKLLPEGETLSAKTVGNIEADRHNPTLNKLKAIAAALRIEVWQLFLPPPSDTSLARELAIELGRRSADDQQDILNIVRKLPTVPVSTGRKDSPLRPQPRRASGA